MKRLLKFPKNLFALSVLCFELVFGANVFAQMKALKVNQDLSHLSSVEDAFWGKVPVESVSLVAQMMVNPKPSKALTEKLKVQVVHDGKWMAFRLQWKDSEQSDAGRLGEFSDAVAIQFPVMDQENPPPFFMGAQGQPVHLFHWRSQYQHDEENGKKETKDIYPNMRVDNYHMDFPWVKTVTPTAEQKELFEAGRAAGNPKAYAKKSVDELLAEGFSTSAVLPEVESYAKAKWVKGNWIVVVARALDRGQGKSKLSVGSKSHVCFAVWQGGKSEVASRKSITMQWLPLDLKIQEL